MEKAEHNNSPEYWERRFATRDWDNLHGEAQTRFFGRLAVRLLPSWLVAEVRGAHRTIADLGCAEGAATVALREAFPDCRVVGIDFAPSAIARARQLHPGTEFQVGSLEAPPEGAEVLVLSNVLEHIHDPITLMRTIAALPSVKYVIILVPLHEGQRHHEHVFTFDYNNFPIRLGQLSLAAFDEVDLRGTPDERFWFGKQAFAVWAHDEILSKAGPTLHSVMGGAQRVQQRAEELHQRIRLLEQDDRRHLVELTEARRQLSEALLDMRRLALDSTITGPTTGQELASKQGRFLPDREAEVRAERLARELDEVRGTLKWRWSSAVATRLDQVGLGAGLKVARALDRHGLVGTTRRVVRKVRRKLHDRTRLVDFEVDPWVSLAPLKPIPVRVVDNPFSDAELPPFAVVTTVRNEEENIVEFLRSIAAQGATPAVVVVVDGGSTDATVALVREFASSAPFELRVVDQGPCNIAVGRNRGLRQITEEFVVFVDAGCQLRPDFFSAMVGPFAEDVEVDLVGGIYVPAPGASHANDFIPDWQRCDYASFLPSARAVAVRAPLARGIGGFPEYLTHTGEDTLFDIAYRRVSRSWVINREAVAEWHGPTTSAASQKLARSYCRGDGESGVGDRRFYRWFADQQRRILGELGAHDQSALDGFIEGRLRRTLVECERRHVRGVVVIFEACQLTDFGGERETTQLVVELTRQNIKVVHVSALGPHLDGTRYLDLDQSLIELFHVNDFAPGDIAQRYGDHLLGVLVETSHPALKAPALALRKLVARAPIILFDVDETSRWRLGLDGAVAPDRELLAAARGKLARSEESTSGLRALSLPPAADLKLHHRTLYELRPRHWPIRWKERVVVVPLPFHASEAEVAYFRAVARANSTIGFVLLSAGRWSEEQARWGLIERNVSGISWQTPSELASWVANAAAVVLPWDLESPDRWRWAQGWAERGLAVQVPVIARSDRTQSDRMHVASKTGFARSLAGLIEHPQATSVAAESWQANAHRLVEFLFDVGR